MEIGGLYQNSFSVCKRIECLNLPATDLPLEGVPVRPE